MTTEQVTPARFAGTSRPSSSRARALEIPPLLCGLDLAGATWRRRP